MWINFYRFVAKASNYTVRKLVKKEQIGWNLEKNLGAKSKKWWTKTIIRVYGWGKGWQIGKGTVETIKILEI